MSFDISIIEKEIEHWNELRAVLETRLVHAREKHLAAQESFEEADGFVVRLTCLVDAYKRADGASGK